MPKKAIDYSKTILYKIVPKDLNLNFIYVGSTTDFRRRKNGHKTDCNNEHRINYNSKIYKTIRENGGWDQFEMLEIEKYACNDGNEARTRERYWMELFNANLNSIKPIITEEEEKEYDKEYYGMHIEKIKEYKHKYYIENINIVKQNMKEYTNNNKEKITQYKKAYNKEYRLKKKLEKETEKNNI